MNRLSKPLFSVAALLALAALACLSNGGETQPPGAAIGKVSLVDDQVEHNNNPLSGIEDLKGNDSIKVFDAGEGMLDFGSDLILRMFNTTSLGGITVASDPGSPLDVRMTLESGGFTGDKVKPGGQAVFTTPNGAKITVYGTSFFVVHDPETGVTTAGNFKGRMEIEAGGSGPVPIPENHSRRVEPGGQPGPETRLPFDRGVFERRARELASPVDALVVVEIIEPEPIAVDTTPPSIELLAIDPKVIAIDRDGRAIKVVVTVAAVGKEHNFSIPDLYVRRTVPADQESIVEFVADRSGIFEYGCSRFPALWMNPLESRGKLAIK